MATIKRSRTLRIVTVVSILLLVLISTKTNLTQAQSDVAEVGVFEPFQVAPGETIQVPISIKGVQGLYGVDVTMKYDPGFVKVRDVDPVMDGIQSALGKFLDPGLLLYNHADNQSGILQFAMAQYNPSEAKSGSGILLVVTFEGVALGESILEITEVSLATREGEEIASKGVSNTIKVVQGAPTQASTYPVEIQPTGLLVIETFTPVPTNTPVPKATITQSTIAPIQGDQVNPGEPYDSSMDTESDPPFLVRNWWILLLLLATVLSVGIIGYRKISKKIEGVEND